MLTLDAINSEIQKIIDHGTNREDVACLADLYVCRAAMENREPEAVREPIQAEGSEFAACVNGRCFSEILPFLEELMEALMVINPRLYNSFIQRLK